jgi:hypothetical protein
MVDARKDAMDQRPISFPDTPTYAITWMGGSCGAFITSLVYQFVEVSVNKYKFSQYGNAHDVALKQCEKNWTSISDKRYEDNEPIYKTINPLFKNRPLILFGHLIPDFDGLFYKYPLCKQIIVTVDENMVQRMNGNFFFKTICDTFPGSDIQWKNIKNTHQYLQEYADPRILPVDVAQEYIINCSHSWPLQGAEFFTDDFSIPDKYVDNVTKIKMHDLIHDPDKVLQTLSSVTGSEIRPDIVEYYQNYLDKQSELVKTKMPWLDDK